MREEKNKIKKKLFKAIFVILVIGLGIFIGLKLNDQTIFTNNNMDKSKENKTEISQVKIAEEEIVKDKNSKELSTNVELSNESDEDVKEELDTSDNDKNEKIQNTTVEKANNKKLIAIDPGHQKKGDNSKEPIGPGATETKAKVTTGATGVTTGQTESELNLKVGLLLQTELENRGYKVIMIRTTNDVNISNSQRADIANNANADAFIRIHADSAESASAVGMSTLCQTQKNPYNSELAEQSYKLSKCVLDNMTKTTNARNRGVTRTDNMSGINWAKVPTTIIEMGFLSNPEEDKLLSKQDYQKKIVTGIANGIDEFIKN